MPKVIYDDISALTIRYTPRGFTLADEYTEIHGIADFKKPLFHKWTPIVMAMLCQKYEIEFEDWWIVGNPIANILLGSDLNELTIQVLKSELKKTKIDQTYLITDEGKLGKTGRLIKPYGPVLSSYHQNFTKYIRGGMSRALVEYVASQYRRDKFVV